MKAVFNTYQLLWNSQWLLRMYVYYFFVKTFFMVRSSVGNFGKLNNKLYYK